MTPRARVVLVSCVWIGCGGEPALAPSDTGAPCDDTACAPYACHAASGTCFVECRGDEQCAADRICSGGRCIGTQCTPETPAACSPYSCVDGLCAADCAAGPCADGFYCGPGDACVPDCQRRSDPLCGGFVCDVTVGECEPYCLDGELACAAGYTCAAGVCVPDRAAPTCSEGCGAYACVFELDRCALRCNDDDDCAASARCTRGTCG